MRELQLTSWYSEQYLVENKHIARHSNGEVMVDCNSMTSSLDLVEERHGGRIDLQRHDPDSHVSAGVVATATVWLRC